MSRRVVSCSSGNRAVARRGASVWRLAVSGRVERPQRPHVCTAKAGRFAPHSRRGAPCTPPNRRSTALQCVSLGGCQLDASYSAEIMCHCAPTLMGRQSLHCFLVRLLVVNYIKWWKIWLRVRLGTTGKLWSECGRVRGQGVGTGSSCPPLSIQPSTRCRRHRPQLEPA